MISVAIDGPSGAGKSSLAKRLAKELGYLYVDTGAMYRAIGLYALRAGADPQDAAAVLALLPGIRIELAYVGGAQRVFLNGEDVSEAIRTEAVGMAASGVSAHQGVRDFLLELQRRLARTHDLLMDGRDIGTVILPNATVKIFLTASAEARAARRLAQLLQKGQTADYDTVLADICRRDRQDTERAAAPLRQAPDAVLVDTSELDFEQSFQALKAIILARV
ncbi:cytidylate kinase [Oscillospiraceae bacterium]|uniref:(d)CMP kinase n=1 Tax=Allofournierella sp. TaxID=1940256 RepID=UPI00207EDC4F|nr:cytidylate kinase [Oscillospiraceae bacterium]